MDNFASNTLYHWIESVYEAFGHQLPTTPGDVALLGVREAVFKRKHSVNRIWRLRT